jgi:transcription elongation factor Elf1
MHYIFELQCPRCRAEHEAIGSKQELPQRLYCSDCLVSNTEIVELVIARVTVLSGNDGVDLFHHVNGQRSNDNERDETTP